MFCLKVQVIIPIFKPDEKFISLLEMLKKQSLQGFSVLIIDSGSDENYKKTITGLDYFKLHKITSEVFNHGRTRQEGIIMNPNADVYVFLTQDAILADEYALHNLITSFKNEKVGCAFGRQIPHKNATIFAKIARDYNYGCESYIRYISDSQEFGIKTVFISNSFAAYRKKAIEEVGGFPSDTILSEDMYVASKMLICGWGIAYCADAKAYHSHNYSIMQEFRRYFDIGVFQSRESWIRNVFGNAEGNGCRFVIYEIKQLSRLPWLICSMICRDGLKYIGYRLGLLEKYLPKNLKRKLSMNYKYWG